MQLPPPPQPPNSAACKKFVMVFRTSSVSVESTPALYTNYSQMLLETTGATLPRTKASATYRITSTHLHSLPCMGRRTYAKVLNLSSGGLNTQRLPNHHHKTMVTPPWHSDSFHGTCYFRYFHSTHDISISFPGEGREMHGSCTVEPQKSLFNAKHCYSENWSYIHDPLWQEVPQSPCPFNSGCGSKGIPYKAKLSGQCFRNHRNKKETTKTLIAFWNH